MPTDSLELWGITCVHRLAAWGSTRTLSPKHVQIVLPGVINAHHLQYVLHALFLMECNSISKVLHVLPFVPQAFKGSTQQVTMLLSVCPVMTLVSPAKILPHIV